MMKNTLKTISGILLLAITLNSCSTESEETVVNALEQELLIENNGVLQIDATTYIFKKTGETSKFINEDAQFDFSYVDQFDYVIEGIEYKHAIEGLVVTNPDTQEFIKFNNFEELKNGKIRFDLELSTGQQFYAVTISSNEAFDTGRWHQDPPRAIDSPLVGAVIEASQEDGHCVSEVEGCAQANGRPAISMKKGKEWFAAPQNCSASCNR